MKRTWLIASAAGLTVLLATFWAGRASRGVQIKTVERVQVKTEVQYKDRVVEKVVHDVQVQHDVETKTVTVTKWAKAPDGTPTVTQETHQERASEAKSTSQAVRTKDATTQSQVQTVELRTVEKVPVQPNWHVEVLVGVQRSDDKAFPIYGPITAGVSVSHRFIGPTYLGVWGGTFGGGAAGVTAGGSF